MPWFVLNHIPPTGGGRQASAAYAVEACNRWYGTSIDLFAPTIVRDIVRSGRHIMTEAPLTYHYVFVHGDLEEVKKLCSLTNGFSFVLNPADPERRYAVVPERDMHTFRTVALAYSNNLPFLDLKEVDLEAGDLVEIVEGDFPGLQGYYMPRPKTSTGDIILTASSGLGTVVYNIKARYVRVLEFSRHSRRAYDQIDAYVPRLFSAMREYHAGHSPQRSDLTAMTIFTRRMDQLNTGNPKLQAKLHALLWATYTILGQQQEAAANRSNLDRLAENVTLPAQRALIALLSGVLDHRADQLHAGYTLLVNTTPSGNIGAENTEVPRLSRADAALLAEFTHYLSLSTTAIGRS